MNDTPAKEPEIKTNMNATREAAQMIAVEQTGVQIANFAQQVDYAKWMAAAGFAIAKDLRNNVGACLAVLDLSQRWGFAPYQVARLCYQVNGTMAFEAQLMIAAVNKHAGIRDGRLKPTYRGEGPTRQCIIKAFLEAELEPCVYESPPIGKITPQNSPLWKSDPDQQLFYYSGRAWARRYCPHVIMGIYGRDEIQDNPHVGFDNAKDVTDAEPATASLHERLQASQQGGQNGFHDGVVDKGLNGDSALPEAKNETVEASTEQPAKKTRGRPKKQTPEEGETQPPFEAAVPSQESAVIGAAQTSDGTLISQSSAQAADPQPNAIEPPKTQTEYALWVRDWLPTAADEDTIEARWASERRLRNTCQITEELRRPIRQMVEERIAQLENAG